MEEIPAITLGEKQAPAQLSFWDSIEPDPATVRQSSDHTPAAEPVPPAQQPAADPAIAPADEAPTLAVTPAGAVKGAPAAGEAPGGATAEPGEQDTAETKPDPIPPGGSIPVRTGREANTSRAVRLLNRIAKQLDIKPMDLRTVGDPILVDKKAVKKLRSAYIAMDAEYQEDKKDQGAGNRVTVRRENRRAWDRARQEINRAFDDLVTAYAADEVVDRATGKRNGYLVYRLPEVLKRQLDNRADSVLARPNGGRILVDRAGFDVGRQPHISSPTLQQPGSLDQETDGERC